MTHTKEPTQSAKGPAVYGIECPQTGRMYVGSTTNVDARKSQHMCNLRKGVHHNRQLQAAFDNDPDLNFIIERTDNFEAAQQREQEILDYGMPRGELLNKAPNAYNPAVGWERSKETKDRMAAVARGIHTGIPKSPEHIEKMRQNALGKTASEETRQRMREAHANRVLSEEEKIARQKSSPLGKAVVIEGVQYASSNEAARALDMKGNVVRYRISSLNEMFAGWQYQKGE